MPGAGAADVAEQVTKPIERAISGVPRLESLQSTSANSIALVIAQFSYGTDVKEVKAQIEQNIQAANLPSGVSPQVNALNINASPVIIASIAATSQDGLAEAARIAQTEISPALLGLEGVASVDITGGETQRVMVTLDPGKLTANGISASQVSGVLSANNLTFPAGQILADGTKIPVSTIGAFTTIDQIRSLVVGVVPSAPARPGIGRGATPGASATPAAPAAPKLVTIGDLGTVEIAGVSTTGYARTDGQPRCRCRYPRPRPRTRSRSPRR